MRSWCESTEIPLYWGTGKQSHYHGIVLTASIVEFPITTYTIHLECISVVHYNSILQKVDLK